MISDITNTPISYKLICARLTQKPDTKGVLNIFFSTNIKNTIGDGGSTAL